MNKRTLKFLGAALAVAIVAGYPAGAWFAGKQIEARLGEEYKQLHERVPLVTVSSRTYERGVFSSTETVTLAVKLLPTEMPLEFTVTSRVRHLPLPGVFALQAAAIDSEVKFDGPVAAIIADWTGGKNPAAIHAVSYFSGGGSATLTIPALNSANLSSDEATFTVDFSKDMATYSMSGGVPKLAVHDGGTRMQMTGIHVSGDHKRVLPSVSLYSGADRFAVELIEVSGPGMPAEAGVIKQFVLDAVATASGDGQFVDIAEKFGAESVKVMGADYGPAKLELSFNHLHAKSVANLSEANWSPDKDAEATLKDIEAILLQNPEVRIDRLSFNRPDGETVVSGLFKFRDPQPGDAANPAVWLTKSYASVDLKMPEPLLSALTQNMFGASFLQGAGLAGDVESMVAEGYFTREEGYVKTRFEFRDAKRWMNGKELVQPAAMNAPQRRAAPNRRR